jgi:1-acyl-sn-glycerol-3-phosphate acyltransferase
VTPAAGRPGAPFRSRLAQLVLGHLLLRPWLRFCFRAEARRAGPRIQGAVVYAANHRSFLDPPFVGAWSDVPVAYFARASLWKNPFFRLLLDLFSGIPVERENPGMSSMKGAIERLKSGVPVLVFPEGTRTRSGRLGGFKDGPALFARRAGVPLVPVYLHRGEGCWPREAVLPRLVGGRIEIRFGRPLVAPAGLPPRQQDAWMTRQLTAWMRRQERELLGPG